MGHAKTATRNAVSALFLCGNVLLRDATNKSPENKSSSAGLAKEPDDRDRQQIG